MNDRDDIYALIWTRADYIRPNSDLSDYTLRIIYFAALNTDKLNSSLLTRANK